jgi:hypothetical protein
MRVVFGARESTRQVNSRGDLQIVVDAVLKEANSRFIVASELVGHIERVVASFVFERQEDVEDGLAHESPDPATQAGLNRNRFQIQRC